MSGSPISRLMKLLGLPVGGSRRALITELRSELDALTISSAILREDNARIEKRLSDVRIERDELKQLYGSAFSDLQECQANCQRAESELDECLEALSNLELQLEGSNQLGKRKRGRPRKNSSGTNKLGGQQVGRDS